MYSVKLEKFEGPFDLLYQLVESKKLEITEISLAQIANQFLDHIKTGVATEDLANFLIVAGRLALIKSRALLPFLELTKEEESDIESLKEQLAEYYKYRDLAKGIHKLDISKNIFYSRTFLSGMEPVFYFPKKLTSEKLSESLNNLLSTLTLPQRIPQAQIKNSISLEEKLEEIRNAIKNRIELRFSEILKSPSPEEKIAAFLSVLELVKRSELEAKQKNNFEDIFLTKNNA
jgi:segregation and condensation protein A